jgi:hypothetical protein
MKLSLKKYPILKNLTQLPKFEVPKVGSAIRQAGIDIDLHCNMIMDNLTIDYVAAPFFDKITAPDTFSKLIKLFTQLPEVSGILLYPNSRFSQIHGVSYSIFPSKEEPDVIYGEVCLYCEVGRIAIIYIKVNAQDTNWKVITSPDIEKQKDLRTWITNHVQSLLCTLTFKHFAEIETYTIGGKDYPKKRKIDKVKYLNESNHQINVLDSRWFRESIRVGAFKVAGHFRFQPCGPGRAQRKLIYVETFIKHGYHRKARKNEQL